MMTVVIIHIRMPHKKKDLGYEIKGHGGLLAEHTQTGSWVPSLAPEKENQRTRIRFWK